MLSMGRGIGVCFFWFVFFRTSKENEHARGCGNPHLLTLILIMKKTGYLYIR